MRTPNSTTARIHAKITPAIMPVFEGGGGCSRNRKVKKERNRRTELARIRFMERKWKSNV